MFELNLIKDKAKARQRRRVIFLAIVTVLFLSGLLSIFVGSLFWKESTDLKKLNDTIASQQKQVTDLTTRLNVEEPAAIKRKLGMIAAYTEDFNTLKRRPYFTPILKDLYQQKPNAEFWYNRLTIDVNTAGLQRGASGVPDDPHQRANALMGPRSLQANGYIQIVASDIVTENDLKQVAQAMDGMLTLLGEPQFSLDLQRETSPTADREVSRYVPFQMRAALRDSSAVNN